MTITRIIGTSDGIDRPAGRGGGAAPSLAQIPRSLIMTYAEFDALYLSAREEDHEPAGGLRRVLVSPATYQAIHEFWRSAFPSGPAPRPANVAVSRRVTDHQIGIER